MKLRRTKLLSSICLLATLAAGCTQHPLRNMLGSGANADAPAAAKGTTKSAKAKNTFPDAKDVGLQAKN